MSVNKDHFRQLLDKYASKQASPDELEELFALIKNSDNDSDLQEQLVDALEDTDPIRGDDYLWNKQFDQMLIEAKSREIAEEKPIQYIGWRRLAVAASIIIGMSVGGYILLHKEPIRQVAQNQPHDIAPGSNKAILKLANGRQLVVTGAKNGVLTRQGETIITKTADGQLAYGNTGGSPDGVMLYDTLIVPRGGQHQVRFADGTIAFINADSRLRIPESFTGKDRTIELISGEAIFQVAYNPKIPFYVKHKGQLTEDLGTAFDLNAYPDEPAAKTTLIEGKIKVSVNGRTENLKPGQQAVVAAGLGIRIREVDLEEITAWKNGFFDLNDENLESIMRKVSRWYDVEVVYTDNSLKSQVFAGTVSRFKTVSQVLRKMELTNTVHFKIEGRRVTVSK